MSIQFEHLSRAVAADGVVTADEILELRRLCWGDGQIHRGEAEAIFAINRQITGQSPEWTDFFVEAIGEFVLNGTEPFGYCDEDEAAWLIAQIDHDGRVESMAELELMVRVVEKAGNVPERLKHYALERLEHIVLNDAGPTRCGGELSDQYITSAECRLVRRLVFASGGLGTAAVSRFDAEFLFRLKDATLYADNAPEWMGLFVDGVANYLKGFSLANAQLSHARTKELEAFVADNKVNVGRFFGQMVKEMPQARNHLGKVFGRKATPAKTDYFAQAAEGDEVTANEMEWLDGMIEANGTIDEYDRALLDRIREESKG